MSYIKLIRFFISACIVLLIGYIFYHLYFSPENDLPITEIKSDKNTYLNIVNFTSTEYKNNVTESVLSAESAVIKSRKFSIFKINQLNELVLKKAVLTINMNNRKIMDIDPFEKLLLILDENISSNKNKFFNIEIDDLQINYYQEDILILKIIAKKAAVKFKGNNTKLKNLILEQPSTNRRIASKSAIWNADTKLFIIDGAYFLETPKDRKRGKKININLDFDILPQN